ncbi:MAG TPA: hypothetical protein VGC96_05220 [Candidatus Elarobacter sp.]|jgi:hypothetical protein
MISSFLKQQVAERHIPIAQLLQQQGSVDEGVRSAAVPVDHDTRLKKIYVYADGVWTPSGVNDYRIVRVQTDAFELSGWIDFTHAKPSDQFQTEIRVTMAHAADVLLQRTIFSAGMLASMHQMTGGSATISGNQIDVVIRQTVSTDNFASPISVAYQFVVESR